MDTITEATIRDMFRDGRIVEAGTLLAMQGSSLSEEELQALILEREQLLARAKAAISQAEDLEISGKTEEAKALYESVLLFAVDYPGIQEHIKRLDEALRLTKAVKRRSLRIRESSPAPKKAAAGKRLKAVLGAGLAVGLTVAILVLVVAKPQSPQVPHSEKVTPVDPLAKEKESSEAPGPIAAQQRTVAPSIPVATPSASPLAENPPAGEPPPAEPAFLSENELPQAPPAPPTHSEDRAPATVQAPLPTFNNQQPKDFYTVRPGDSLSLIAERLFCNESAWRTIYRLNRDEIANPNILHSGMVLRLNGIENLCPAEQ